MVGILSDNSKLVAMGSVAAASGILIGGLWLRRYLKNRPPAQWTKVGEIEELFVYPVKSFKGISPASFECTSLGAKLGSMRDRSFVVVDQEGKFVTGRDYPGMTRLVPVISGNLVSFSCPDLSDKVEIDINKIKGEKKKVLIWWSWVEGIDCGDEIASWLSRCILKQDSGLRLLYFVAQEGGKKINYKITSLTKSAEIQLQKDDGGAFSDGVAYHLISEASVKELNSRLDGVKVSASNFRPNFAIKGDPLIPFEEDNWKWVKIGDVIFQCLAPCTRCVFTTIDPNTGEKAENMEPLTSLRRYRHVRDPEKRKLLTTPAMGIYLGLRSGGKVSVGDEVFISEK